MRTITALLLSPLVLALVAATNGPSPTDSAFVRSALQADAAELSDAAVAANSSDPAVRAYAGRITADHTQATNRLVAIAGPLGIDTSAAKIPSAIAGSSPEPAGGANAMQVTAGNPPAAEYFKQEIAAHERTISLYQKEAQSGDDSALKQYARQMIPVLQQHLQLAQKDLSSVTHGR